MAASQSAGRGSAKRRAVAASAPLAAAAVSTPAAPATAEDVVGTSSAPRAPTGEVVVATKRPRESKAAADASRVRGSSSTSRERLASRDSDPKRRRRAVEDGVNVESSSSRSKGLPSGGDSVPAAAPAGALGGAGGGVVAASAPAAAAAAAAAASMGVAEVNASVREAAREALGAFVPLPAGRRVTKKLAQQAVGPLRARDAAVDARVEELRASGVSDDVLDCVDVDDVVVAEAPARGRAWRSQRELAVADDGDRWFRQNGVRLPCLADGSFIIRAADGGKHGGFNRVLVSDTMVWWKANPAREELLTVRSDNKLLGDHDATNWNCPDLVVGAADVQGEDGPRKFLLEFEYYNRSGPKVVWQMNEYAQRDDVLALAAVKVYTARSGWACAAVMWRRDSPADAWTLTKAYDMGERALTGAAKAQFNTARYDLARVPSGGVGWTRVVPTMVPAAAGGRGRSDIVAVTAWAPHAPFFVVPADVLLGPLPPAVPAATAEAWADDLRIDLAEAFKDFAKSSHP
uniref:Uncharacterized protein n=1 Tax=Bicosoecida sp. CB-2014 TaxID=1486930 RepID=A0A7S1CEU6_9STRA|mmetsp:Transcript_22291/g.78121  ORF Transcript_22291/g.78121 Transcript_22291/m.78121 type:complete len:518 (+) Transcript_22291:90-1643(+)